MNLINGFGAFEVNQVVTLTCLPEVNITKKHYEIRRLLLNNVGSMSSLNSFPLRMKQRVTFFMTFTLRFFAVFKLLQFTEGYIVIKVPIRKRSKCSI